MKGKKNSVLLPVVALLFFVLIPEISAFAQDVILAWDANTETDLAGYKIYYGTSSRNYSTVIDVHNVTTYGITGLGPGTYYFAATAYNTANAESGYSNEVSATIGSSCTYNLSSSSQSVPAGSSTGSVSVISQSGCSWAASSNAGWIAITSGGSGSGNGSVNYSVAANTTRNPRTGTLTVAGRTLTVTQARIGCDMNQDTSTNIVDVQVLINIILGQNGCSGNCDVNGDGSVNVVDLQTLQNVILGVGVCP